MINITDGGSVKFLICEPDAQMVDLVGAFDAFTEQRVPMHRRSDGVWEVDLELAPGDHLFRYLVNGVRWRLDPDAHGRCTNASGEDKSRVWLPPKSLDPDAIAA